jgi:hypothetical protein
MERRDRVRCDMIVKVMDMIVTSLVPRYAVKVGHIDTDVTKKEKGYADTCGGVVCEEYDAMRTRARNEDVNQKRLWQSGVIEYDMDART